MSKHTGPHDLLALARAAVAPDGVSPQVRRHRFGDTRDHIVARRQIWRAAWEEVSVLVLVCYVSEDGIDVIPVTVDPGAEDEQSVVVDSDSTALGVPTTYWVGLRTNIPLWVFDEIVDELSAELADWITFPKHERVGPLSAIARNGRDPVTPFESGVALRSEIEDDLSSLQSAQGLPVADDTVSPPTLASILGKDVGLRALVNGLRPFGVDQSAVMSLLRGKRPITPAEADAIARITGLDPARIAQAVSPLPVEFVAEVDHPRWRPLWRERAERDQSDETSARLKQSYEMYARAARQTGDRIPDWPARLAQFRQLRNPPPR